MKYYIDLGSNVIKIYEYENEKISLIEEKDILFQENFDEEEGISRKKYRELMIYLKKLIDNYSLVKIIVTYMQQEFGEKYQMNNLKL